MKVLLIALLSISIISCAKSSTSDEVLGLNDGASVPNEDSSEEMEKDESVLSPEDEELFFGQGFEKAFSYKFAQTSWKECTDKPTGNYYGYKCASSRNISVILKSFMQTHMHKCVSAGLAAQGGGTLGSYNITHAGITGDPRHSPKSMHAENRAIDIKSFQVKLTSGVSKTFVFEGSASAPFFNAFRTCWGGIVNTFNGCPLYKGTKSLTGSIGKENADHQHHMHTSVPYCLNGAYGPYYYQK